MYVNPNVKTKKAFREHVAEGKDVALFQPGLGGPPPRNGKAFIEGPHYPEPHTWYAEVTIVDGRVVKVK
jgi:hypothetical protein